MSFFDDMDLSLLWDRAFEGEARKEKPMKPYYWIMVVVAGLTLLALYLTRGGVLALTGAGLWVLGWATHKHRTYVESSVARVGSTVREKLVNWWRS